MAAPGDACGAGRCPPSSLPPWAMAALALLALLSVIFFLTAIRHLAVRKGGPL